MSVEFSQDNSASSSGEVDAIAYNKEMVRKLVETNLPNVLKSGWGELVRWRQPIFAKNVEYTFPFIPKGRGRVQLHMLLSFMDLLTIWEGIEARVSDVIEFSSPSRELLIFTYLLLVPIENSRTIIQQHVRIVLRFNNEGLIERWDETWSYSTEEILEKVWKLDTEFDAEFVIQAPKRDELTENIFRLPDGEGAARKFRKNVDEVVEFLVGQFPRLVTRGADMEPNERENMYKYFSDDGKFQSIDRSSIRLIHTHTHNTMFTNIEWARKSS